MSSQTADLGYKLNLLNCIYSEHKYVKVSVIRLGDKWLEKIIMKPNIRVWEMMRSCSSDIWRIVLINDPARRKIKLF